MYVAVFLRFSKNYKNIPSYVEYQVIYLIVNILIIYIIHVYLVLNFGKLWVRIPKLVL